MFVLPVFRPFYRTEMMIITAKNPAQWPHTNLDPYNPGTTLMGPVVNLTILQEVIDKKNTVI